MEADLNLSQSLGGLRIANPDNSLSPVSSRGDSINRGASVSPLSGKPPDTLNNGAERAHSPLTPSLSSADLLRTSSPLDFNPKAFSTDAAFADRRQTPVEKPASPKPQAHKSNLNAQRYANRQSIPFTYQDQQQAQFPQYPTMMPLSQRSASSATRPVSAMYTQAPSTIGEVPKSPEPSRLHKESSRSSMYGTAGLRRSSSRAAATAMQAGVPIGEASHTERAYKQSPMYSSNGGLPPRKSSRGMGSTQMQQPTPHRGDSQSGNPYGLEGGPMKSSEEWQEKGAAVGLRKEVDANGNQVLKHVKKGVKDFKFGRTLGEGSYSTVMAATDRQTGKEYAIKVLDKRHIIKEKKVKYVNIEKDTLNRLTDHPGVVRLYYTFQDEQSLYFVLDLASSGELLGVLKRTTTFDEECTRFYCAEILDTIDYMHARGVIHRDLKPENVLLDDHMHVKITDFGTAKILELPKRPPKDSLGNVQPPTGDPMDGSEDNRANSFVGTAEYVSPELLTDKKACKASDLWAFGCIVYQLLAGRPPFKAGNEYLTFQKIVALEYTFPRGFPEVAKDLVERLLVLDPASRLSIEHVKNHQFFDGVAWGKGLWRQKTPTLKPFIPAPAEPMKLNGFSSGASYPPNIAPSHSVSEKRVETPGSSVPRPSPRIITELPPPSQLDIEWSPVLTNVNERILKLGNLLVNTTPGPHSPNNKNGLSNGDSEAPKKLSRFFGGGNAAKKRQRLVMVTTSARIIIVAAGGEDKKSKVEIDVRSAGCTWNKMQDPKGLTYWCVDTPDKHYTFESPATTSASDLGSATSAQAQEWLDVIDRSREIAFAQSIGSGNSYTGEDQLKDLQSVTATTGSTRALDLDSPGGALSSGMGSIGGNLGVDSSRNTLHKSPQQDRDEGFIGRKRFSKRASKSGLAAVF
ncbi:uncharacterized protein KY384_007182 [Bacidia gigantensis]|uniref:uncharacterized protein n=1 Tax=Bacidia gigantensis TaxID=2732470 RepID=UPI001D040FAA|nr:uncharacterized protein KY384_007182 [Bacidia gigantensis]KAG8528265.1 hypothetical protein KY384_007182 [Bacidia gigantensis]